jgi:hypothetical protein
VLLDQGFAAADDATQDANPVREEAAVGWVVNGRLHHRPINAQLASLGNLGLSGQFDHSGIERLQRVGMDSPGPAIEGTGIRHGFEVEATEPTEDQAVGHKMHRLTIAPVIEVLDHQQPEDGFTRSGVATGHEGQGIASSQVGTDLAIELLVLQEPIELSQDRIGMLRELRDTGKDIVIRVAINEHASTWTTRIGGNTPLILALLLSSFQMLYSRYFATATSTTVTLGSSSTT